jgi:hypothetical protein
MPGIDEIAKVILAARRKRFLFSRPVFKKNSEVSEAELFHLATRLDFIFIIDLSKWLLQAGYGEIDEALVFHENKFSKIDWEPLQGFVTFAASSSGHQIAFNPEDGSIYSIFAPRHEFARIADDFPSFLQDLVRHDYKLKEWMDILLFSRQSGG